ncbi:TPA: hypothetical protein ACH3X1_005625 [Trebouxia sp. C0004]
MKINLWKHYSTSTDAERDAHLGKFHLRFQKLKSGEINANASVALNDYEHWCQETFGEIRAIDSLQMYDDRMTWLAAKKAMCKTAVEIGHRAQKHIATLAAFHGYLPSF